MFCNLSFRFDPPVVPKNFVPHHKFRAPLDDSNKHDGDPPPPEAIAPEDNNLKLLIEGVATLVARCGKLFEDLSREKNQSNPLFSFLTGGNGCDYYARKLWEERQKHNDKSKQLLDVKSSPTVQKMTAESRGKILGERPLERSSRDTNSSVASADVIQLQFNLSDTFTKPASLVSSMIICVHHQFAIYRLSSISNFFAIQLVVCLNFHFLIILVCGALLSCLY